LFFTKIAGGKPKSKTKKKGKEDANQPRALNENPPLTNIVPGEQKLEFLCSSIF